MYTNLPRRNPGFRGRENEMAELLKRLSSESRAAVVVVYGLLSIETTEGRISAWTTDCPRQVWLTEPEDQKYD